MTPTGTTLKVVSGQVYDASQDSQALFFQASLSLP